MTAHSSIQIRPAGAADLPTIITLINALADFEKLPGPDAAAIERLRQHGFGPQPRFYVSLAESAGQAAGYAFYYFTYSTFEARPTLYLEDLFVLPEYRRQGVAYALMQHLARRAIEQDCARLDWAVLDWNQPAIDFYERLGAAQLKEWIVCRLSGPALQKLSQ